MADAFATVAGKPRASGDDPGQDHVAPPEAAVNPARAGMIPATVTGDGAVERNPRASGDDPAALARVRRVRR